MLISVIIPVYNAEKYLRKAIDSLINQTNTNIEIILVNDGSTDTSGQICDEYKVNYNNIKVVHKINGGISTARNTGIENSTGDYIMFLDSDDYFEMNVIDIIIDRIQKYNPDILDFGIYYNDAYGSKNPGHHKLPKEELLNRDTIVNRIIPQMINVKFDPDAFVFDYVWNKIYKRSIIIDNNIRFLEKRRTWEDRPFIIWYLKYTQSYYSISANLYNYVSIDNSLSRRYELQFFDIIMENYKLYNQWFLNVYDFHSPYSYMYWSNSIENMVIRSLEQKENLEQIYSNIYRIFNNELVLSWFVNREILSEHDKNVNKLLIDGKINELIIFYKSLVKKRKKTEKRNRIKMKIYNLIKHR